MTDQKGVPRTAYRKAHDGESASKRGIRCWAARWTAPLVGAIALACTHHAPHTTTTTAAGEVATSTASHWAVVVTPITSNDASISGRADIRADAAGIATVALFMTGLQPGQTYVWHIRRGPCLTRELLGPPSEYAPLSVDGNGRGSAAGSFPVSTAGSVSLDHLDVHPAGGPPIACGEIRVDTGH